MTGHVVTEQTDDTETNHRRPDQTQDVYSREEMFCDVL